MSWKIFYRNRFAQRLTLTEPTKTAVNVMLFVNKSAKKDLSFILKYLENLDRLQELTALTKLEELSG